MEPVKLEEEIDAQVVRNAADAVKVNSQGIARVQCEMKECVIGGTCY